MRRRKPTEAGCRGQASQVVEQPAGKHLEPGSGTPMIALFVPNLGGGGAERITLNLALAFLERGIHVEIVLVRKGGVWCAHTPANLRIVDLGVRGTLSAVVPLARYLRAVRPTALLSALDHANVCALFARRLSGVSTRTVIAIHAVHSYTAAHDRSWRGRLQRMLMRRCYRWADAVVAVSHGVADVTAQMTKVPRSRIHVIYNPVVTPEMLSKAKEPLEHPWFAPGQPQVAMAVGSLLTLKDFFTLIRAFSTLRKDRAVRLMILGEGPERPRLEGLVRELHLEDDVALPGFVENPYAYMSRAAVLVLSSKWEALPSVLIEGLALGVPVVSTDCDFGPREILAHGKYGTLVPVGDADALAEGVRQALCAGPSSLPVDALAPFGVETPVREYLRVLLGESHA